MKSVVGLAALTMLSMAFDAQACRCREQPLATYFDRAVFVAMGRLVAVEEAGNDRMLSFELVTDPYKGDEGMSAGSRTTLASAASSASCGVQPVADAVYLLFGQPTDAGPLRIDTCSGSRVHLAPGFDEPAGFVDVPARFVAGQLIAQFGLDVLRGVSQNAPDPTDPENETLVGLLDLDALAKGEHLTVRARPIAGSTVIGRIESWDQVDAREVGYEVPAAIVYARSPGWFRLRLTDGRFGWLPAESAGTWIPYAELPVRRLAYMTDEWSGLTWPDVGAGLPLRSSVTRGGSGAETPAEVVDRRDLGGLPWFRVNILASDPCSGHERRVLSSGWVPGYGRNGRPTVWYYSRGC